MTHFDTELNQIAYIKNLIEQTSNLPISILNCKQEIFFQILSSMIMFLISLI